MPRTALSQREVEDFRGALCDQATRLFAAHGYEGVTMRALANALGCSPMTPYRYFENKAEIFDAVRSASAARFAEALEQALASVGPPGAGHARHRQRLAALCRGYVAFALREPHAYRILFELDHAERADRWRSEDLRSWFVMRGALEEAIADGALEGDLDVVAHLLWSGVHGLVALHLSGMLALGLELEPLVDAFIERELGQVGQMPGSSETPDTGNPERGLRHVESNE